MIRVREILVNLYYDQEATLRVLWLGAEDDKRLSHLRGLEEFSQSYHDSILVCAICSKLDGDKVYIPWHKSWYYTDCLKKGFIYSSKKKSKSP